jgi:hypothetical protein
LADGKGSLITVSSTAAFHATKGNPAYAASKAGAVGLTRTLAAAWAPDIRVNGIAPGLVDTKLTRVTTGNPERLAASLSGIPLGRLGTPGDMAGAALFLASPLAAYVVGQTIPSTVGYCCGDERRRDAAMWKAKRMTLADRLAGYLSALWSAPTTVDQLTRIPGGASRETYRFDALVAGASRPLILRRDPVDSLIDTDRRLEFLAYQSFHGSEVPVPEPVALETGAEALDRPFFIMGRSMAGAPPPPSRRRPMASTPPRWARRSSPRSAASPPRTRQGCPSHEPPPTPSP